MEVVSFNLNFFSCVSRYPCLWCPSPELLQYWCTQICPVQTLSEVCKIHMLHIVTMQAAAICNSIVCGILISKTLMISIATCVLIQRSLVQERIILFLWTFHQRMGDGEGHCFTSTFNILEFTVELTKAGLQNVHQNIKNPICFVSLTFRKCCNMPWSSSAEWRTAKGKLRPAVGFLGHIIYLSSLQVDVNNGRSGLMHSDRGGYISPSPPAENHSKSSDKSSSSPCYFSKPLFVPTRHLLSVDKVRWSGTLCL